MTRKKWIVVGVTSAFFFGVYMGDQNADPQVDVVRVPDVSIITIRPPTPDAEFITNSVIPDSCLEAMVYSDKIYITTGLIDESGTKQLDIISQAHIALGIPSLTMLDKALVDQDNLQSKTSDAIYNLSNLRTAYAKSAHQCRIEVGAHNN